MTALPSIVTGRRRSGPQVRVMVAAGLIGLSLAGCKTTQTEIVGAIPDDYRLTHPIVLGENLATLDVPVGPDTPYLTADMKGNIAAFGDTFMRSGGTAIAIVVPTGAANERAARAMAGQIAGVLRSLGIPPRAIDQRAYSAEPLANEAPIRLAFARIEARTKPCGLWEDQSASSFENRHYGNYSCATQTNLAAMVSNPLDLIYPRRMTPADAERRSTVLGRYRTGDPTQTDLAREPKSNVAEGVGQ